MPVCDTFQILSHFITYWHQDMLYYIEKRKMVPICDFFSYFYGTVLLANQANLAN